MSSTPIANRGIAGSAPASVGGLRQRADEDHTAGRRSQLPGDGDVALATAADLPPSNVIELESPPLRRAGVQGGAASRRINPRAVELAVRVADVLVVAAAGAVTYWLEPGFFWPLNPTAAFVALAIMVMLGRSLNAEPRLLRDTLRRPLPRRLRDAALQTLLPFILCVAIVMLLLPAGDALRLGLTHWLALWAMGAVAGACAVRVGLSGLVTRWRGQGRLKQAVAIFGTGELAERLLQRLRAASGDMVELVGVFDDRSRRRIANPALRSLAVGTSDDLVALSRQRDIDRVLVALPHSAEHRVAEVVRKLHHMPVEISLAPDLVGYNLPCRDADELAGLPLVAVYGRPLTFTQVLLKSAIDRTLAGFALLIGAPLFLGLAIAIKLDSKGPVLFRQNRDGFGDRRIGVYKFRTMYAEATDTTARCRPRRTTRGSPASAVSCGAGASTNCRNC